MRSWTRWFAYAAVALFVIPVIACARAAPTPAPAPKAAAPAPVVAQAPGAAPTVAPAPKAAAPAPAPAAAKKPKNGGILRVSNTQDAPSGWDPTYDEDSSFFITAYSSLIRLDPRDGKIIGDLAESWEVKDDGKTYVFHLRKNVVSHDGKAVDAEDVKLSVDRYVKFRRSATWPSRVASTEVVDQYTVAIRLKSSFAGIAPAMATSGTVRVVPKHIIEKIGGPDKKIGSAEDVIGTGAFRLTGFALGAGSTLVRFDKYFLQGKPYLDGIATIGIKDPTSRLAAYRTGNIDYLYAINIEGPEATFLKKNFPDHIVRQFTESRYWQFHMPNKPPWNDLRVRQALNLVFDRKAVITLTEEGVGLVGSYVAPKYGGLSEAEVAKLPGYRYPKDQDIQEAKRLMAQAGFASGISGATIVHRNLPAYQDVALAYVSQLEKALGFKFISDLPPDDGAWKNRETNCLHNGFFHRNTTGNDPEDQMSGHISKAGYYRQKCGWDLPAVDKLYDEQAVTADPTKRTQLLREIDKILSENLPFIQLHYSGYWASAWPFVKDSGIEVFNDIRSDQYHIYTWLDK